MLAIQNQHTVAYEDVYCKHTLTRESQWLVHANIDETLHKCSLDLSKNLLASCSWLSYFKGEINPFIRAGSST